MHNRNVFTSYYLKKKEPIFQCAWSANSATLLAKTRQPTISNHNLVSLTYIASWQYDLCTISKIPNYRY